MLAWIFRRQTLEMTHFSNFIIHQKVLNSVGLLRIGVLKEIIYFIFKKSLCFQFEGNLKFLLIICLSH